MIVNAKNMKLEALKVSDVTSVIRNKFQGMLLDIKIDGDVVTISPFAEETQMKARRSLTEMRGCLKDTGYTMDDYFAWKQEEKELELEKEYHYDEIRR